MIQPTTFLQNSIYISSQCLYRARFSKVLGGNAHILSILVETALDKLWYNILNSTINKHKQLKPIVAPLQYLSSASLPIATVLAATSIFQFKTLIPQKAHIFKAYRDIFIVGFICKLTLYMLSYLVQYYTIQTALQKALNANAQEKIKELNNTLLQKDPFQISLSLYDRIRWNHMVDTIYECNVQKYSYSEFPYVTFLEKLKLKYKDLSDAELATYFNAIFSLWNRFAKRSFPPSANVDVVPTQEHRLAWNRFLATPLPPDQFLRDFAELLTGFQLSQWKTIIGQTPPTCYHFDCIPQSKEEAKQCMKSLQYNKEELKQHVIRNISVFRYASLSKKEKKATAILFQLGIQIRELKWAEEKAICGSCSNTSIIEALIAMEPNSPTIQTALIEACFIQDLFLRTRCIETVTYNPTALELLLQASPKAELSSELVENCFSSFHCLNSYPCFKSLAKRININFCLKKHLSIPFSHYALLTLDSTSQEDIINDYMKEFFPKLDLSLCYECPDFKKQQLQQNDGYNLYTHVDETVQKLIRENKYKNEKYNICFVQPVCDAFQSVAAEWTNGWLDDLTKIIIDHLPFEISIITDRDLLTHSWKQLPKQSKLQIRWLKTQKINPTARNKEKQTPLQTLTWIQDNNPSFSPETLEELTTYYTIEESSKK